MNTNCYKPKWIITSGIDPDRLLDVMGLLFETCDTRIDDAPLDVKTALVEVFPSAIQLIKNPEPEVMKTAATSDPYTILSMDNPPDDIVLMAIQKTPDLSSFIKRYSPSLLKKVLPLNADLIGRCKKPSRAMQKIAVEAACQGRFFSIHILAKTVTDQDLKVQLATNIPEAIPYIQEMSSAMLRQVVRGNTKAIGYIDSPSEALQIEAVLLDTEAADLIHYREMCCGEELHIDCATEFVRALADYLDYGKISFGWLPEIRQAAIAAQTLGQGRNESARFLADMYISRYLCDIDEERSLEASSGPETVDSDIQDILLQLHV